MNPTFKTVLIPVDLSENNKAVVDEGLILAKMFKLEVILLHIINFKTSAIPFFGKSQLSKKEVIDDSTSKLNFIADEAFQSSGIKIHVMVEDGKFVKILAKIADLFYSRFIVMDLTNKTTETEKTTIVSELLHATEGSRTQVVTLNNLNNSLENIKHIIIPLDLTKESRQKVPVGIDLAHLTGATIKLISIEDGGDAYQLSKLKTQIESVATFLQKNNIPHTTDLLKHPTGKETPCRLILNYAKEHNGDLIMTMIHQEDESNTHAQQIMIHAEVPVVSVVSRTIGSIVNF